MLTRLIDELMGAGYSEARIGKAVGLSQPSVNRIRRGVQKNVNFAAVDALRKLHGEVVKASADEAA
jgi:predicted transcriptional regulator